MTATSVRTAGRVQEIVGSQLAGVALAVLIVLRSAARSHSDQPR